MENVSKALGAVGNCAFAFVLGQYLSGFRARVGHCGRTGALGGPELRGTENEPKVQF